mgnify:CR=1 FL=1
MLTQLPTAPVPCTLAIIHEDQSINIGSDFEAGVEYGVIVRVNEGIVLRWLVGEVLRVLEQFVEQECCLTAVLLRVFCAFERFAVIQSEDKRHQCQQNKLRHTGRGNPLFRLI